MGADVKSSSFYGGNWYICIFVILHKHWQHNNARSRATYVNRMAHNIENPFRLTHGTLIMVYYTMFCGHTLADGTTI